MPFTFSHPVAILPFAYLPKRWVSVTGLVIGSIVPDFEKFIKMQAGHSFSHTLAGVFYFNLPLALGLAFLFHTVLRNTLIDYAPLFLRARFTPYKTFQWHLYFINHWSKVLVCILLGAFTHLFLDSFTHFHGGFVQDIPYLKKYFFIQGQIIYHYQILEIVLSLLGGLLCFVAVLKIPASPVGAYTVPYRVKYWLIICSYSIFIIILRIVAGAAIRHVWDMINIVIAALLLSVFITTIIFKRYKNNLS